VKESWKVEKVEEHAPKVVVACIANGKAEAERIRPLSSDGRKRKRPFSL